MDITQKIKPLHAAYERLTGMQLTLNMSHHFRWENWLAHGFTEQDLALVVGLIRKGIKSGKRNPGALKLSNLIGNVDGFAEDLALARAEARVPTFSQGRQQVLRGTGRQDKPRQPEGRSAAAVLESKTFSDKLKEWRQSNL